jgi:hypothetical protein
VSVQAVVAAALAAVTVAFLAELLRLPDLGPVALEPARALEVL